MAARPQCRAIRATHERNTTTLEVDASHTAQDSLHTVQNSLHTAPTASYTAPTPPYTAHPLLHTDNAVHHTATALRLLLQLPLGAAGGGEKVRTRASHPGGPLEEGRAWAAKNEQQKLLDAARYCSG